MPDDFDEPSISRLTAETAELHDNTLSPRDDRRSRGQAMAAAVPHSRHSQWSPSPVRDDLPAFLEATNQGRIPELIPIRYGRMLPSPFTFFRGTSALMAADLATTPTINVKVQACGDCHLLNFGAFATPERNVVFDINDFDETLPAPWEWDLKRLAASFVLSSRDNGIKEKQTLQAARTVSRAYRKKMAEMSRMSVIDIWYERIEWQSFIQETQDEALQKQLKERLSKALKRDDRYYFPKLTEEIDGQFVIKDKPPLVYHPSAGDGKPLLKRVDEALKQYMESLQDDKRRLVDRYRLADVAVKVVGVGSVGTMCLVALLLAPDAEPLFLQLKEARPSVLEPYVGKTTYENNGERVTSGQRIMQSASDIFLGWTELDGKHFYVRHLRDMKIKLEPETWEGKQLIAFAELTGSVLARAHARSGDAAVIAGYLEDGEVFDESITAFAHSYADQVTKDHEALLQAVRAGRLEAKVE